MVWGNPTIAANLAVLLSEAGTKRILVMEVDQQHIGDVQVLWEEYSLMLMI